MKSILICRTDRIGDFVLSLPFIYEIRKNFPKANIDLLISPAVQPLMNFVKGVDNYIIYDKVLLKRSIDNLFRFATSLRSMNYDLAIALNPNLRLHFLLYLSGIRERYGWNTKWGRFLLTKVLAHTKARGIMHESQYNMLFLPFLGVDRWDRPMPKLFLPNGRKRLFSDLTVGIHPDASCPSKRWPRSKFLELTRRLIEMGLNVVFIGGKRSKSIVEDIIGQLDARESLSIRDMSGLTLDKSVEVIAGCDLFISNDSGPVHIASAVDVPSVVIFGRNDPGLSPYRWKPLHPYSRYIHKADCEKCLAHNCNKNFSCLQLITAQDVINEVETILVSIRLKGAII